MRKTFFAGIVFVCTIFLVDIATAYAATKVNPGVRIERYKNSGKRTLTQDRYYDRQNRRTAVKDSDGKKYAYFSLNTANEYIWRGINLSDGFVLQPSLKVEYYGFSTSIWANYNVETGQLDETDLSIRYQYKLWKWFTVDAGYIYYALDSYDDTQEIFAGLITNIYLKATVYFYYDFDEGQGGYLEADVSYPFKILDNLEVTGGVTVGYNLGSKHLVGDHSALHHMNGYAMIDYNFYNDLSAQLYGGYSASLSEEAKLNILALSKNGKSQGFYLGLGLKLKI